MSTKKFKLLEKIETENSIERGAVFTARTVNEEGKAFIDLEDGSSISADFLIREGYIEEVDEGPKFKVGDYAITTETDNTTYIKIFSVEKIDGEYQYNEDGENCYYKDYLLRKPTEEELKKYFR